MPSDYVLRTERRKTLPKVGQGVRFSSFPLATGVTIWCLQFTLCSWHLPTGETPWFWEGIKTYIKALILQGVSLDKVIFTATIIGLYVHQWDGLYRRTVSAQGPPVLLSMAQGWAAPENQQQGDWDYIISGSTQGLWCHWGQPSCWWDGWGLCSHYMGALGQVMHQFFCSLCKMREVNHVLSVQDLREGEMLFFLLFVIRFTT